MDDITNRFANVRDSRGFWGVVRLYRGRFEVACEVTLDEWDEFLRAVYKPGPRDFVVRPGGSAGPSLDGDVTAMELERALKDCKVGKAPGGDLIPNEPLKAMPENWRLYLIVMFNNILASETSPRAWSTVIMTMLFKRGCRADRANYRGIALVNCTAKIFTYIIRLRLEAWVEKRGIIPECQAGFRKKRCCADNVFALQSAIQLQLRLGGRKV